jgi:hypothetical protein
MLADGVEATVRAMAQNGALDKMVANGNSEATESVGLYNDTASLPEDAIGRVYTRLSASESRTGSLTSAT